MATGGTVNSLTPYTNDKVPHGRNGFTTKQYEGCVICTCWILNLLCIPLLFAWSDIYQSWFWNFLCDRYRSWPHAKMSISWKCPPVLGGTESNYVEFMRQLQSVQIGSLVCLVLFVSAKHHTLMTSAAFAEPNYNDAGDPSWAPEQLPAIGCSCQYFLLKMCFTYLIHLKLYFIEKEGFLQRSSFACEVLYWFSRDQDYKEQIFKNKAQQKQMETNTTHRWPCW